MKNLRVYIFSAALAAFAANAALLNSDPEYALILGRQAPGTPQYECHSDCGNTITGGRIDGHCDNSTWVGYYKDCMECALEYNIWRFYEDGVTAAASPCRLDAVPVPSGVDMTDPSSTAASDSSIVSPSGSTTAPTMPQSSAVSSNATVTTAPPGTESSTPVSTSPPGTTPATGAASAAGTYELGTLTRGVFAAIVATLMGVW